MVSTCKTPGPRAPAHPRHAGAALAALPAARPVKVLAAARRGPARGPLKTNLARRWAYSSRPPRLTKFRGAQPSSCLCCVTANVRLVRITQGAISSWARSRTRCSSCCGGVWRILAVKMRIHGFLTITNTFKPVLTPPAANHEPSLLCRPKVPYEWQ